MLESFKIFLILFVQRTVSIFITTVLLYGHESRKLLLKSSKAYLFLCPKFSARENIDNKIWELFILLHILFLSPTLYLFSLYWVRLGWNFLKGQNEPIYGKKMLHKRIFLRNPYFWGNIKKLKKYDPLPLLGYYETFPLIWLIFHLNPDFYFLLTDVH